MTHASIAEELLGVSVAPSVFRFGLSLCLHHGAKSFELIPPSQLLPWPRDNDWLGFVFARKTSFELVQTHGAKHDYMTDTQAIV